MQWHTYIKPYFQLKNAILYGIFHVMHEMRLLMPITRVLTDSLTHSNAKCENQSLVFHPMTHWITLQCLFNFTKSRVFPWVANFQGLTVGFACLPTLSRTYIVGRIGLIENKILVFHPEGGSAPSYFAQTHKIYYYYFMHP